MLNSIGSLLNEINGWDVTFLLGILSYVYWFLCIRRIPTHRLGLNFFAEVIEWESLAKQRSVAARGWVTAAEWFLMKRRFAKTIRKELTIL